MKGKKPPTPPFGLMEEQELPSISVEIPCPDVLSSSHEKKAWSEVTRMMTANNLYGDDCCNTVIAYCVQIAKFREAEEHIREEGAIIKITKSRRFPNPWLKISNDACDRLVKLASELGLTPTSRKKALRAKADKSMSSGVGQFLEKAA